MSERDEITAPERWTFDDEVTDVFEDMLSRSIPQYEVMRDTVRDLVVARYRTESRIIDLGTSRGTMLDVLVARLGARGRYVGVDVSEPMLEAAHEKLAPWIANGYAELLHWDLRRGLPPGSYGVVLSILTLQFVPIEYRQKIIASAFDSLEPDGTIVVVEKVLGETARIDSLLVDTYLGFKESQGYTPEQNLRKRLSLEGVLVPVTAKMTESFLVSAGFEVDCFWRWMNFAAWIGIKRR